MANLVIVESPSKAKTLKNYLGSSYVIMASKGHVRDLPAARLSVDVKKDFEPKYSIVKGKESLVKELKEAVKDSDKVFLATDPDREGEAISWHLAEILGLDLNEANRVTFNEITKTGVKNAIDDIQKNYFNGTGIEIIPFSSVTKDTRDLLLSKIIDSIQ